jgi:TnpA family transposase
MPGSFLNEAERERLRNFPSDIPSDDLITYFTLSPTDMAWVRNHRGDHNRLGTALQLCALRYLGFCPDDLSRAPAESVAYLADQLEMPMEALDAYGVRVHTRTDHFLEAAAYLGFSSAKSDDLDNLMSWLVERALEHDRGTLLFQLAAEKLHRNKIVRPGVTILERLVAAARVKAQTETHTRMMSLLTDERRVFLDYLLIPDASTSRTPLAWLRQSATANSPNAILTTIEKLIFLRQQGVNGWNLAELNPNRLKHLAQLGKKSTNQALQRASEEKRYPVLLSFLHQMHTEVTDELLDLYIRCLAQTYKRSKRDRDEFSKRMANSIQEKVRLFQELGSIVLDTGVSDDQVRAAIYQLMSPEKLYAAVQESEQLIRPLDDNAFDFLEHRYSYIRTFAPAFLDACIFCSHLKRDPLLEAINLLRQLNKQQLRRVPEDAPISFVPAAWQSYVMDQQGQIDRHYYELCALSELRNALRSGDIWVEGSRRYADPQSYLIPIQQWPGYKDEVCRLLQTPMDGRERLQQRQAELGERLCQFDQALANTDKVRIENEELVVSPLEAEELPESCLRLQQLISERVPHVELTDLLIEVDSWTHFTRRFEHAGGDSSRTRDIQTHLYAGILAQACNFGLDQMAEISDVSYRQLAWCNNWYVREDTLQAAIADIVNFQYRQPLSRYWGGGTLSSSDGQRFPVSVKTQNATALPRYFGYGRGLTFYTWTSDQFSQYGTKVIPATVRDATYVLDAILDNET